MAGTLFKGKNLILVITVPIAVLADQITKFLAIAYLKPLVAETFPADRYVSVVDGFWRFKYAENAGAAFGLFRDSPAAFRIPFFILVSLLAVGFIVWFYRKIEPDKRLLPLSVSLVLGGAVGNLIDRLYMGKVVDFIDWYFTLDSPLNLWLYTFRAGENHWPTFNVADAAITMGVLLLIIEFFVGEDQPANE